jgi:DNA primase
MTISEAKEIHLVGFLEMNGVIPLKVLGGKAWYYSLLRPREKTASFIINLKENTWHDFGTGEHGDIIDLIIKLYTVDVKEALQRIGSRSFNSSLPNTYDNEETMDDRGKISIERIQEVTHPALVKYIAKRKVSLLYARLFLKEAYYLLYGRRYFALAFQNDLGGYEFRNERYKIGNTPKYFTTIKGKNHSTINVFEGFMDFLSWCTYSNTTPESTTIILNSLSFLPKVEPLLSQAKHVNLFLDNDDAGRKATEKIRKYSDCVKDLASVIYFGYKDFNEFIMKG